MPAPWTSPERRALREMWRRGLQPAVIATSLQAQFGHRYRAADIPGRVRDFGFLGEHPEAPPVPDLALPEVVAAPPVEAVNVVPDRNRWPEPAVERLTIMWQDGASGGAIAAALTQEFGAPRTRNAVMGMVHRLGLKGQQGRPSEEPVEAPSAAVEAVPEPDAPAQPKPIPVAAGTTKSAPEYARDHASPASPPLTVIRSEPRPADWPPADGIPMADLRWGECRWAVSNFRATQHRFCAARATGDSPYCAEHRRSATAPREVGRGPGRYPGWVADGGAA